MKEIKKELFYTCILAKDREHAKNIIAFYKKAGFSNPYGLVGELADMEGVYYYTGALFVDISVKKPTPTKEIELPIEIKRRKFPREMMVSDDKINWRKQKVFGKLTSTIKPYLTCFPSGYNYKGWKYAKEIE